MAITLGEGGVMIPYLNLCRWGVGGKQGNGRQMFSWIHIDDLCHIIDFLYERKELQGVFNASAPHPVTNKILMESLRKQTGAITGLPAPAWLLKAGATLIGTETELLLKSRWVLPARLTEAGYTFHYSYLDDALRDLIPTLKR
jgi:uncharacterized protein